MAGMTRRRQLTALLAGVCALATACAPLRVSPDHTGRVRGRVSRVIDGDTVVVRIAGRNETIRLIGVNTPETHHPTKPVECFGPEASAHTAALLPSGTDVWVERDVESRDRYGRLLGYVHRSADDLFVNLDLVAGGWAVPYPFPPNTTFESRFAEAATAARASSLGLWGRCSR